MRKHFIIFAALGAALLIGGASQTVAADKGGPAAVRVADASDAPASWTGFGLSLRAGVAQGAVDAGGPVGINSTGQDAGAAVFYRHQYGPLVLGVDAAYEKLWGDLHTIGIDYNYNVGATIAVMPTKTSLIGTRAEWIRAVGSGQHIDGWGLGLVAEQRIANTPLSIGILYMHDWMDQSTFGPGINVTADRVLLTGTIQLYAPSRSIFSDR